MAIAERALGTPKRRCRPANALAHRYGSAVRAHASSERKETLYHRAAGLLEAVL
jgi:hypothetical protein